MESETKSVTADRNEARGEERAAPRAPRDPEQRRSFCYVLFEAQAEATARPEGRPSQEVYLDNGRLAENVRWTSGVEDESILKRLGTCEGFRELVHSIGVTVETGSTGQKESEPPTDESHVSDSPQEKLRSVTFLLQHWGKSSRYETGTTLRIECPADGAETLLELDGIDWSADDDVPGKMAFEFDRPGELAKVTVALYLNDGYAVPEPQMDPPVDFDSEAYAAMIERSQLRADRTGRLRAAIDRAQSGEPVTLAYIGGSITQGAGAKPIHTECYAHRSYRDFVERFEKTGKETEQEADGRFRFVKAGVGGTPSELGMIRYERDILRGGDVLPAIVVVEYAVNDADDETEGVCYESLCRKILNAPNRPAVILLFSVFMNDWNLQDRLLPIAERYGLPAVSIKDAVAPQFGQARGEGGIISKRQFFYDIYHPTNDGHRIMADCLGELFRREAVERAANGEADREKEAASVGVSASGSPGAEAETLPDPVYGAEFENVRLLDRKDGWAGAEIDAGAFTGIDADLHLIELDAEPLGTPQLPHNWMRETAAEGEDNRPLRLKIRCRNLLLIFKDSGSPEFGKADVYVDGELRLTADPHRNNWTHCNTVLLFSDTETAEHEIEIRMAAGDEDKTFTVLAFGYTE